jgi:hypothetical protein
MDQARHGRALQLGQVLAGEVGDEVRGGVDGPAVDRLHRPTIAVRRDSLCVTIRATLEP